MAKKIRAVSVSKERQQYVGISRDHSGSMARLANTARRDYNQILQTIQNAARKTHISSTISVVSCGINGGVRLEENNRDVHSLNPILAYPTDGSTPLFDSVGELIKLFRAAPNADDPNVTFLIMVITDGEENSSRFWTGQALGEQIKLLQATDRWTFTFRVPRGYAQHLAAMGIPAGNIAEWEQTEEGLKGATGQTVRALGSYYSGVHKGITSSRSFYADASTITRKEIKAVMTNISNEVVIWPVKQGGLEIKTFVEKKLRRSMEIGAAFYQLSKPEKAVQDYKMLIIRDKRNGAVYAGKSARDLLNLPDIGTIRLAPGDHGNYDIYIQSTSVNRKLIAGTNVLYWTGALASASA